MIIYNYCINAAAKAVATTVTVANIPFINVNIR